MLNPCLEVESLSPEVDISLLSELRHHCSMSSVDICIRGKSVDWARLCLLYSISHTSDSSRVMNVSWDLAPRRPTVCFMSLLVLISCWNWKDGNKWHPLLGVFHVTFELLSFHRFRLYFPYSNNFAFTERMQETKSGCRCSNQAQMQNWAWQQTQATPACWSLHKEMTRAHREMVTKPRKQPCRDALSQIGH